MAARTGTAAAAFNSAGAAFTGGSHNYPLVFRTVIQGTVLSDALSAHIATTGLSDLLAESLMVIAGQGLDALDLNGLAGPESGRRKAGAQKEEMMKVG